MITRIVKLTFLPSETAFFIETFESKKKQILAFDGCADVMLLRDVENECTFFTHSIWRDKLALDAYRASEFFRRTWSEVKTKFAAPPQAWSLNEVE